MAKLLDGVGRGRGWGGLKNLKIMDRVDVGWTKGGYGVAMGWDMNWRMG